MKKNIKERNVNLDVIRTLALITLVSVHFLLNNSFYQTQTIGWKMYVAYFLRSFFMICVPLFLLLTGFLMNKKKDINKKFYKGLIKIILNYILAMIFVYIAKCIYNKDIFSSYKLITYILSYQDSAWYVNMYIGLFLLIPFLNTIYWNLDTKRKKQYLVLTLLILTTLPSIANIFNFKTDNWLFSSKVYDGYNMLVPNWWVNLYPITYYFIGAYLSEYKINISKFKNCFLIFIVLIVGCTFNFMRSYGNAFEWSLYTEWGSIQNILSSTLIFIFIINLKLDNMNGFIKKIFTKISDLSFVAYLVHQVFELILYNWLSGRTNTFYGKMLYYIPLTLLILALSLFVSWIINLIYKFILFFASVCIKKGKGCKIHAK